MTRCYHTWTSDTWASERGQHVHACRGQVACHEAPCRCECGALDYCVLSPIQTGYESHRADPPKKIKA